MQQIGCSMMRVWDVSPEILCRNHLLGEHRELHAVWTILTENKNGYSTHPETLRWVGRLHALYLRHNELVKEISKRGYEHNSPLDKKLALGDKIQTKFIDSIQQQIKILKTKKCDCKV
jgi:hypothetical protein